MRQNRIYLLHPNEQILPGVTGWVSGAEEFIRSEDEWELWDIHTECYDSRNSFLVQPLHARIMSRLGPIVLLRPVHRKAAEELRRRVGGRAIVIEDSAVDSDTIFQHFTEARRRFENSEPFLPRKYVAAVLLVRKLRKGNYWSGKEKGYLWGDDLAKGRGVDERYADIIIEVANDLIHGGVMIYKTSQGTRKYALNPNHRSEVHAIADYRQFANQRLEEILRRDRREVSSHELLEPSQATRFAITSKDGDPFSHSLPDAIIAHTESCPHAESYTVTVMFEGDRVFRETVTDKRIACQIFDAFR